MRIPTIHLNGTSESELLDGFKNAYTALGDAFEVVQRTAPNARDYYVQSANAIGEAIQEHRSRLIRLEALRAEFETIILAIQDRKPFARQE